MDGVRERLALAQKALETLKKLPLSRSDVDDMVRDAAIQRFEYTFEAMWKATQLFLREVEGLEFNSPKAVIRGAFRVALLDEAQTRLALQMADDRNLTARTYNGALAQAIFSRLSSYAELMDHWLRAMTQKV